MRRSLPGLFVLPALLVIAASPGCVILTEDDQDDWDAKYGGPDCPELSQGSVTAAVDGLTDPWPSSSVALNLSIAGFTDDPECGHYQIFVEDLAAGTAPAFWTYGDDRLVVPVGALEPGGEYRVWVSLVDGPWDPGLRVEPGDDSRFDFVEVTIDEDALYVAIVSPQEGAEVEPPFALEFVVRNFVLDDPTTSEITGDGHWHVYTDFDGDPTVDLPPSYVADAGTSLSISDADQGARRYLIRLHGQEHQVLTPATFDEVTIEIDD